MATGDLSGSSRREDVASAETVVLTIGTPIDEFQNPVWDAVIQCVRELLPYLRHTKLLILRSTVSPGATDRLQNFLTAVGLDLPVAFCPEHVVQGHAIDEIQRMPQIISGTTPVAERRAAAVFERIASSLVLMKPMEAEFAKLFCNAYRYIQFAASNQFYMMAQAAGCDYGATVGDQARLSPHERVPRTGVQRGSMSAQGYLAVRGRSQYQFEIGYAAIHINEGLPSFVVNNILSRYHLADMTVGILGMAFKAESDDIRSSLSYKLKKLLRIHAHEVLTTDPFVTSDPEPVHLTTSSAEVISW